jgi:hypothetical protein
MNKVVHEEPVGSFRPRSNEPLLARVKEDRIAAAVRIKPSSSNQVLMRLLSRFEDLLDGIILFLLRERTQQSGGSHGTCQPLTSPSTNLSDNRTLRKQLLRVVRV